MNKHTPNTPRVVRLFRNGRNQAIRIPVEFELPGEEVTIRQEGGLLIVEPMPPPKPKTFADLMRSFEVIDDEFPDIDGDLLPPREIKL